MFAIARSVATAILIAGAGAASAQASAPGIKWRLK